MMRGKKQELTATATNWKKFNAIVWHQEIALARCDTEAMCECVHILKLLMHINERISASERMNKEKYNA